MLEGMHARLERERGWRGRLRSLPTTGRYALSIVTLSAIAAAVLIFARRSDFAVYPVPLFLGSVIALSGLAVAASVALLRPEQRQAMGARRLRLLTAAGLAVPVVLAMPQAHDLVHLHPESFLGTGDDFIPRAFGCFMYGLITALPFVVLMLLLDRKEARSIRDIVLFAAAGGLAGNLTLLLHCPLVSRAHLLAGHVPVALGFLALLLVAAARRRVS